MQLRLKRSNRWSVTSLRINLHVGMFMSSNEREPVWNCKDPC